MRRFAPLLLVIGAARLKVSIILRQKSIGANAESVASVWNYAVTAHMQSTEIVLLLFE